MSAGVAPRQHGLSLVELLASLAIAALIMAPLLDMLRTTTAASAITHEQTDLQRQADFALERIAARIRATAPPAPWQGLDQKVVDGQVRTTFGPLAFFLDNAGRVVEQDNPDPGLLPLVGGLLVEPDERPRTLADSVRSFSIAAPATGAGQPMVEVRLTLARGMTIAEASALVRQGSAR